MFSFQQSFLRPWSEIEQLDGNGDGQVDLWEVVSHMCPHALVGVTGQPGLFTEDVIRAQAAGAGRPIVLPLSNPTPQAEAIPSDVIVWTEGRALIGTGSPFDPVSFGATTYPITQVDNGHISPRCRHGRDNNESTRDVRLDADGGNNDWRYAVEPRPSGGALLPPITQTSVVAIAVAIAVGLAAVSEGLAAPMTVEQITEQVEASFRRPVYRS